MHFLLDSYKIYKGFNLTDTSNDEKLSLILTSVENFLREQYGIYLTETTITEKHLVNSDIVVVGSKINSIIEITDNKNNSILTDDIDWFDNIIYLNVLVNAKLIITYTTGYTAIPEALKLAIFILTDKLFEDVENNTTLLESFSDPVAGRQNFKKVFPPEVNKLLAPFISYKIG